MAYDLKGGLRGQGKQDVKGALGHIALFAAAIVVLVLFLAMVSGR